MTDLQKREANDAPESSLSKYDRMNKVLRQAEEAGHVGFGIVIGAALGIGAGVWWAVGLAAIYFALAGVLAVGVKRALRGMKS